MATGAPSTETYISHIKISAFPDLGSNFLFLDYTQIANDSAQISYKKLRDIGYSVKLDQFLTGAGGTGALPSFIELLQLLWDNKTLFTLPFSILKLVYFHFFTSKPKAPGGTRRLPVVTVNLSAHSKTLTVESGIYIEKEHTFNTLLECATLLTPELESKYPHVSFRFNLDLTLDMYKTRIQFILNSSELSSRRLPRMFQSVGQQNFVSSQISISGRIFYKRVDFSIDPNSDSEIWSYTKTKKVYYYLIPGRILWVDYKLLSNKTL